MSTLVCYMGVIGSGKDYHAKELVNQGYLQINFADALREMCWKILGWRPANDHEYELFKAGGIDIPGWGYVNGRLMLQNVGKIMREIYPDFWKNAWFDKALSALTSDNKNVVCSDLRYPNELKCAFNLMTADNNVDTKFVFCDYHSEKYNATDEHESEKMAQELLKYGFKDGHVFNSVLKFDEEDKIHNFLWGVAHGRYNDEYAIEERTKEN